MAKKIPFWQKLKWRLFFQMLVTFAAYIVVGVCAYFILYFLYHLTVWQKNDWIYQAANWFELRMDLIVILYILVGFPLIFLRFWKKPFMYLQEVFEAADRVYRNDGVLIELSGPLNELEKRMNQAKLDMIGKEQIAREAEQRKNDLITYLAHDLKTPITSVIGYLTLLRDEPDLSPEMRARYTGISLNKAERLEDLINELFDITRFSLSKLTLEPERVNLSRMLEQVLSEFAPILAEKEMRFSQEIEPDVEIVCDPDKLERVFDNLIRNAVNYGYRGTEIRVSMQKIESRIKIGIVNHGKDIPPEKLSRIFDQFFRVDSSRASATGGTGLGLAIAKKITELHGGKIMAESADEKILFTVILPEKCQKIV